MLKKLNLFIERKRTMKKMKFITLVLTFALLLSSFAFAVSAAEESSQTAAIVVDGKMGENEGWEHAKVFNFGLHVMDPTGKDAVKLANRTGGVTGESSIRFVTDGENLYVYYETSNSDTFNTEIKNAALYLRIVPAANTDMGANTATDGSCLHFMLNVANAYTYKSETDGEKFTTVDGVKSVKDWATYQDGGTKYAIGNKGLVGHFGFTGTYNKYGHYTSTFAESITIGLHVEKEADAPVKKGYEIKIPLCETFKTRLGTQDPTFYFLAYERSNTYNGEYVESVKEGSEYVTRGTTQAGYALTLDGETPVSWGNLIDDNYKTVQNGIPVVLPMNQEDTNDDNTNNDNTNNDNTNNDNTNNDNTNNDNTNNDNTNNDNTNNDNTNNDNTNNDNTNNDNTNNDNTNNDQETTTQPAQTTAATAKPAEEKKGCGSSIALTGMALVAAVGASAAVVCKKRKDD
jgi:hypothetical protein